MTKRSSTMAAMLVTVIAVLVSVAFLRLGTRHRALEARTALLAMTRQVALSIDDTLAARGQLVEQLARSTNSEAEFIRRAQMRADDGEALGFVVWSADHIESVGPTRLVGAAQQQLVQDAQASVSSSSPIVFGPYRADDGGWVVVVTPPAPAVPGHRIGTTVRLDELLMTSGARRLINAGYQYRLAANDPQTGQPRVVARSSAIEGADEWREPIVTTLGEGWALSTSPKSRGIVPGVLVDSLVVGLLSLGVGLVTFDLSSRARRIQTELDERTRRLQEAQHQLMDEVQHRTEVEREFAHAGFHDVLTGLPNRRYFVNRVSDALAQLRRNQGGTVTVLMLSLDRFRSVSETLGYPAGDDLAAQGGRRLAACLTSSDSLVARVANGEFGMLVRQLPDVDAARTTARRLQDAVADPFQIDAETIFTPASVGIALHTTGYLSADELLREADLALSRVRPERDGKISVFDRTVEEEIVSLQQLETDLHHALEREEFKVYYQPIVSLSSGQIVGMEALIRWQHPLEGLVNPGAFIGVAETMQLIVPINRWVLRTVCRQAKAWRESFPSDTEFYFSTNLSGRDLQEPDLCDYVEATIREHGLPSGLIRLEVTESTLIENTLVAVDLLERMRQLGVPLLLDDFGTGYSSLSYLNRYRVDYLKIDKAFVRRVAPGSRNHQILRTVVHLAHDLGIAAIAEGIETEEDLTNLLALGCDYGQGYHFSRPVPPEKAEQLLRTGARWSMNTQPAAPSRGRESAQGSEANSVPAAG